MAIRHDRSCRSRSGAASLIGALADRLNFARAFRERAEQIGLRPGHVEPRCPIVRSQDGDLPVVVRLHVLSGLGCPHREGRGVGAFLLAPEACNGNERCPRQRETMLRLGVALARELEERRCGDEAAVALVEPPSSDLKLKSGQPRGLEGGKPKVIGTRSTPAAVQAALDRFGRIDVLANIAGRGSLGRPGSSRPSSCASRWRSTSSSMPCSADSAISSVRRGLIEAPRISIDAVV